MHSLDETDKEILNLLQGDGKLTAKNLADKIGLTQTPVYERIRKLERLGIIEKYVALINPELIERELVAFTNITVRDHTTESRQTLIEELLKLPRVIELFHMSGTFDFMAKVRIKDVQEYREFLIEKLGKIENIKDITSHIVLEEIKTSTQIVI